MAAVPEDLRCKRSDGKQWRCSAPSVPGKTVCEKHYVQAKKRSASSALRATLRRSALAASSSAARLRAAAGDDDQDEDAPPPMAVARPLYGRLAGEAVYVAEPVPAHAPARRGVAYEGLPLTNAAGGRTAAELVGRGLAVLPDGLAAGARSCHQCRKPGGVIWCTSCDRRGYCAACIARCLPKPPPNEKRLCMKVQKRKKMNCFRAFLLQRVAKMQGYLTLTVLFISVA